MTTNLFPLPYWAPALRRVPTPLLFREKKWSLIGWLSCQRVDFCLGRMGALLRQGGRASRRALVSPNSECRECLSHRLVPTTPFLTASAHLQVRV